MNAWIPALLLILGFAAFVALNVAAGVIAS